MTQPVCNKWKLLPEIHASRVSLSGSLRPKIGLLLLLIVLLVSLCFILVPTLKNLEFFKSRTYQVQPIPYSNLLWKLSDGKNEHVVISPHVIESSLSMVNGSNPSQCLCPPTIPNKFSKSYINISAIVLNAKNQNVTSDCKCGSVSMLPTNLTNEQMLQYLRNYLQEQNFSSKSELQNPSRPVIAVSSFIKLFIPAEIDDKNLVFTGEQVIKSRDYTLVKVKVEDDENLELFFMQMNRAVSLSHSMLEPLEHANSQSVKARVVFPRQEIKSCHDLAPQFSSENLGHLYHKASLQLIPSKVSEKDGVSQTVPDTGNRSDHEHVLTLDKNLVFILKYYKTVIQLGKLSI